jgi:hypothetical protein
MVNGRKQPDSNFVILISKYVSDFRLTFFLLSFIECTVIPALCFALYFQFDFTRNLIFSRTLLQTTSHALFLTKACTDKISSQSAKNRPSVSLHILTKQIREVTFNVNNPAIIHNVLATCSTAANDLSYAHLYTLLLW